MSAPDVPGAAHLPYPFHRELFAAYAATGRSVRVYRARGTNAVRVSMDGHRATCVRDARIKAERLLYGRAGGAL